MTPTSIIWLRERLMHPLEPTPEVGDKHVYIGVILPYGRTLSRVRVIEHKCDTDGNPIGKANYNPILYSHHYLVYFEDVEVT